MAKITRFDTTSIKQNTSTRVSRPQAEATIAKNNLSLYETQLSSMTNQTNVLCTLYMVDNKETTFSETLGLTKMEKSTHRYIEVRNFVLVGSSQEEFESQPDQERSLAINLADKEFVVLPNTVVPKEEWYVVFDYQPFKKPYVITERKPVKYNHKDAWLIKVSESKSFTHEDLLARVTKRMEFVFGNIGTGMSTIIDKGTQEFNSKLSKYMDNMQSEFVSAFYSVEWDILGFTPSVGDFSQMITCKDVAFRRNYVFNHYANDLMQKKQQILKYGYDRNVLFLSNIYKFDREEVNYRTSIYELLLKRKFKPLEEVEKDVGDTLIQSDTAILFDQVITLRDFINESLEYKYTPKYSYSIKYFLRRKEDHMILTRIFNSGIVLVDMLNTSSFIDPNIKSTYYTYELRHPRICEFLDKYMDKDYSWIVEHVDDLDEIYIDKDNIDDYIGIPMLLLALSQVYKDLNAGSNIGTYE